MSKVLILLNAGPNDTTRIESAFGLANMLQKSSEVEKVALIFFGDAVELLTNPKYAEKASQIVANGTLTLACQAHAEKKQIQDTLSGGPIPLKYVGEDIVTLMNQGYQVITF